MTAKVTYVVPTYNKERFIVESLESIINQSRWSVKIFDKKILDSRGLVLPHEKCDIEILVIDDGSTDNSIPLAEHVLKNEMFVEHRIITLPENRGLGYVMWKGFREAKGDYICYLSPDDFLIDSQKTWKQVQAMESDPTIDVSFYNRYIAGETLQKGKVVSLPMEYNFILRHRYLCFVGLMHKNVIGSTSLMFRKGAYFRLGEWDKELRNTANDGELTFRYLLNGANFRMLNGNAMFYRVYKDQMSAGSDFYKKTNAINEQYKQVVYDGNYPLWMKLALRCIPKQRY